MDPTNLRLPLNLRKELAHPMGKLIKGTIKSTIPLLKNELAKRAGILVGVGDVTADILVHNGFKPEIVITDGKPRQPGIRWRKTWTAPNRVQKCELHWFFGTRNRRVLCTKKSPEDKDDGEDELGYQYVAPMLPYPRKYCLIVLVVRSLSID